MSRRGLWHPLKLYGPRSEWYLWQDFTRLDGGSLMILGAAKTLRSIVSVALITCAFANALCSVDVVIVRGRVDRAPGNAKVRVQLVYARDMAGGSGGRRN